MVQLVVSMLGMMATFGLLWPFKRLKCIVVGAGWEEEAGLVFAPFSLLRNLPKGM